MKVLVTGSSGMLGAELCRQLQKDHEAIGVSKSGRGGTACDLADAGQVRRLFERPAAFVVHTAAYSDVDGCEQEPKRAYE